MPIRFMRSVLAGVCLMATANVLPAEPVKGPVPLPPPRPATDAAAVSPLEANIPVACKGGPGNPRLLASPVPPVTGPDGCGIAEPLQLTAILSAKGGKIQLQPAALVDCGFASAFADWLALDVVPSLPLGEVLVRVETAGAYECRGRNRQAGGRPSEHATGNALDINAFVTSSGQRLEIGRQSSSAAFFRSISASACTRFMTVLGPGSDGFHETHLHLDLQPRASHSHFCQWIIN